MPAPVIWISKIPSTAMKVRTFRVSRARLGAGPELEKDLTSHPCWSWRSVMYQSDDRTLWAQWEDGIGYSIC
jgi:hypothetical protein